MRHDNDLARDIFLPLTSEGLALELGSALDPSPPFLVPAVRRLAARLRASLAPRARIAA
jgi:hypothetical protein